MSAKPFETLTYAVKEFVGIVNLNRPPVNALGKALVEDLFNVCKTIESDVWARKVRVVIFRTDQHHFCAGADLKERKGMPENEVPAAVNRLRTAVHAVGDLPIPTIACIKGSAMGGGLELALACDFRFASEEAKMGLREVQLAIIPGAGGTQRLPRIVGYSTALKWIVTGQVHTAEEALNDGVVNGVSSLEDLDQLANNLAKEIASAGPVAVLQAKKAVKTGMNMGLREALDMEFECYKPVLPTKDRVEALNAFAEKRSPNFQGE